MIKRLVLRTLITLGMMSLFANMAYEGSRAIIGPYLAQVGSTGLIVGCIAGLYEFLGHLLRLLSSYFSDKTKHYWHFMFLGYSLNLLAIPALAFVDHWLSIAAMLLLERLGRAMRSRPRDKLLTLASTKTGIGTSLGFGIHASLNQLGRVLGPLLVAVVVYGTSNYQISFFILAVPVLLCLVILLLAYFFWAQSGATLEEKKKTELRPINYQAAYKPFVIGSCFIAFGYADFMLMGFHLHNAMPAFFIPILYAIAMSIEGIFGFILGILYDAKGIKVLSFSTFLSALSAPLFFHGDFLAILAGTILWGIGMSAQNILMKACVASLNEKEKRRFAYGVFDISFGSAWFVGSVLLGFLYDFSLTSLVVLSSVSQLMALPFLYQAQRLNKLDS